MFPKNKNMSYVMFLFCYLSANGFLIALSYIFFGDILVFQNFALVVHWYCCQQPLTLAAAAPFQYCSV